MRKFVDLDDWKDVFVLILWIVFRYLCRMEGERGCHASDSSKAGTNDDNCAVRWTVEEVSKENKTAFSLYKK